MEKDKKRENNEDNYGFDSDGSDEDADISCQFYDLCSMHPPYQDSHRTSRRQGHGSQEQVSQRTNRYVVGLSNPSVVQKTDKHAVDQQVVKRKITPGNRARRDSLRKQSLSHSTCEKPTGRKRDISATIQRVVRGFKSLRLKKVTSQSDSTDRRTSHARKTNTRIDCDTRKEGTSGKNVSSCDIGRRGLISDDKNRKRSDESSTQKGTRRISPGQTKTEDIRLEMKRQSYHKITENLSVRRDSNGDQDDDRNQKRLYATHTISKDKGLKFHASSIRDYLPISYAPNVPLYDPTESMSSSSFEYLCHFAPQRKANAQTQTGTISGYEPEPEVNLLAYRRPPVKRRHLPVIEITSSSPTNQQSSLHGIDIGIWSEASSSSASPTSPCLLSLPSSRTISDSGNFSDRSDSAIGLSPDDFRKDFDLPVKSHISPDEMESKTQIFFSGPSAGHKFPKPPQNQILHRSEVVKSRKMSFGKQESTEKSSPERCGRNTIECQGSLYIRRRSDERRQPIKLPVININKKASNMPFKK